MSTFYTLRNQRNIQEKILKLVITITRSKVKSRSQHDVAHLQHPMYLPIKYQLPTPYRCRSIAGQDITGQGTLRQGQIKVTL